jgi:hypothetical protein
MTPSSYCKSSMLTSLPVDVNTCVPAHTHIPSVPAPNAFNPLPKKLAAFIIPPIAVPKGWILIAASEIPSHAPCKPADTPPASPYISDASGKNPVSVSAAEPITLNGFIDSEDPPDPPDPPKTPLRAPIKPLEPPELVFVAIII